MKHEIDQSQCSKAYRDTIHTGIMLQLNMIHLCRCISILYNENIMDHTIHMKHYTKFLCVLCCYKSLVNRTYDNQGCVLDLQPSTSVPLDWLIFSVIEVIQFHLYSTCVNLLYKNDENQCMATVSYYKGILYTIHHHSLQDARYLHYQGYDGLPRPYYCTSGCYMHYASPQIKFTQSFMMTK